MELTDEQPTPNQTNAPKSTGPRTPTGKRTASLNSKKFDTLANALLIVGESRDAFREFMRNMITTFQPDAFDEYIMLETMAIARWRIYRLLAVQTAGIRDEQRRRAENPIGADDLNPSTRAMKAMETLAEKSNLPENLSRAEARYERQYQRAAQGLARLKNDKNKKISRKSCQPAENKEEGL